MRRVILWESISRAISTSRLLYAWADCLAMYVVSLFLPERWHSVYFLPRLHWAEVYRLLHWAWGSVQALTVVSLVIMKLGICNIVLAAAIVSGRALFKKKEKKKRGDILVVTCQKVKPLSDSFPVCMQCVGAMATFWLKRLCSAQVSQTGKMAIFFYTLRTCFLLYVNMFLKSSAPMVHDIVIRAL